MHRSTHTHIQHVATWVGRKDIDLGRVCPLWPATCSFISPFLPRIVLCKALFLWEKPVSGPKLPPQVVRFLQEHCPNVDHTSYQKTKPPRHANTNAGDRSDVEAVAYLYIFTNAIQTRDTLCAGNHQTGTLGYKWGSHLTAAVCTILCNLPT